MSTEHAYIMIIYIASGLSLLWAAFHAYSVIKVKLIPISHADSETEYLVDS